MAEKAYDRVSWRGVKLTARQRDAVRWAERKFQKKYEGVTFLPAQGSWANGSLSGGTHSGAGALDLRTRHLTDAQRVYMVRCLKDAGQAVWFRADNWDGKGGGQHAHLLDIGGQTGMDAGAKWQIKQFDAKRSALVSNKADNTYHPSPKVKFSYPLGKPIPR